MDMTKKLLLILSSLFLGQLADAQYAYQLVSPPKNPSGGAYSGLWYAPYTLNNGSYSGGGPGPATCSGTVTYLYTLRPGMNAPSVVIENRTSSANWVGQPGTADDGLNDPYQTFTPPGGTVPINGWSNGSHPLTVPNPGSTVTVSISPKSSSPGGTCSAGVSVSLTEIAIQLTGVADSANDIMIGQRLGGNVIINGVVQNNTGDTFNWNVSGDNPFGAYIVKTNLAPVNPDSSYVQPYVPQTTPSFWAYLRTPGSYTVTCQYYSAALGQTFSLSATGFAYAPSCSWGAYMVLPSFVPNATTPTKVELTTVGSPTPTGIVFSGSVTTPALFTSQGSGWWSQVQLITPDRAKDGTVPHDTRYSPVNGTQALDTSFPYETAWGDIYDFSHTYEAPADGTSINPGGIEANPAIPPGAIWMDAPAQSLINTVGAAHSVVAFDSFHVYMMYYPPGAAQYVPLKDLNWYWKADAHINVGDPAWSWDANEAQWSFLSNYPAHPTWQHRLDTSFWTFS